MSTIGDIFDIPEAVHQGDFVLRLSEGLQEQHRQQTLDQYVVTPQLVQSFDQALSLIGSAITSQSSKGAYLHGSFGSGKSHFMAVLDMILEGNSAARSIPALAEPIRKANAWWEGGKYLVVPFHMLGAESMEAAILGGYAEYVRHKHPDAPTPGLYRSTALLDNARNLRQTMGEQSFFDALGSSGNGDGWGRIGAGWDAASFEAAAGADPNSDEHQRLVGDLVDTFFTQLKTEAATGNFISLDRGLAVMSRHARDLGYSAVVLFLDELILWLASHASDTAFLNREGQKVPKLVEAADAGRPIPIVSFIARQRDLRELVSESVPGAEQLAFADVLQWSDARFDEITLADRNLPAIIERRLLKPKGDTERKELQQAFEKTTNVRREVLDILLTHEGDKAMFEQVYPFSPALVQALVALSGMLQRERTALKLMLQLLIKNRDRVQLGDVIPVGDLFDVITEGEEPFTATIKNLFDRARKLWSQKLMPLLEAEHDVADSEVRDGTAGADVSRRYRTDAGLLKTLLLSALASEVEALRELTPARLAALNHGTVRSPLPNGESRAVLNKVRGWASHVGDIQISADPANPVISMQLSGVDVEGILENARGNDNFGNRVRAVRDLLFGELNIDPQRNTMLAPEYDWIWQGTPRRAEVVVNNIRACADESLRPGDGVWRLVIDYPFDDDPQYTPADDRVRLDKFRDKGESVHTLAWIPSFLNARALEDLGRFVVLEYLLSGNRLDENAGHLSPADRREARATLKNQRDQLEQRVRAALKQAYGIAQGASDSLNTSHTLDDNFQSLASGLQLQPPPGGSFKDSIDHLLGQALAWQYPAHPHFPNEIKRVSLKHALATLQEATSTDDGRVGVERNRRHEIRSIVEPLKLAACGEAHLSLGNHWVSHFDRQAAKAGTTAPTVKELRQWMDDPQSMGLPRDVADLVILTWAAQTGRSAWWHEAPAEAAIGKLQREYEFREQALPPEAAWQQAVQRAADLFGEAGAGASRNAGNVAAMVQALQGHAGEKLQPVQAYRDALHQRARTWAVDPTSARLRTASACLDLLTALADSSAEPVQTLADAVTETSTAAMGSVMACAPALAQTMQSSRWEVLETLRQREQRDQKATGLLDAMAAALVDDEHVTALAPCLKTQHDQALASLTSTPTEPQPEPEPEPPQPTAPPGARRINKHALNRDGVAQAMQELRKALDEDSTLRADIDCRIYHADDTDDAT